MGWRREGEGGRRRKKGRKGGGEEGERGEGERERGRVERGERKENMGGEEEGGENYNTTYTQTHIHAHPMTNPHIHNVRVKLSNSLNDGNTTNQHQCQVIIKDPEKTQDPAGMDLLITSQTLLPLSHWISRGRGV